MTTRKKIIILVLFSLIILFICIAALTSNKPAQDEPINRSEMNHSGKVVRVDIPNQDGTFTTLLDEEAQQWYDNAGKNNE